MSKMAVTRFKIVYCFVFSTSDKELSANLNPKMAKAQSKMLGRQLPFPTVDESYITLGICVRTKSIFLLLMNKKEC